MYNVPSRFDSPAVDGRTVFTSSRMLPRQLADVINASTHTGLRDRALLGVLAYTFARISVAEVRCLINPLDLRGTSPGANRKRLRDRARSGLASAFAKATARQLPAAEEKLS